jgi:hypothetical protein
MTMRKIGCLGEGKAVKRKKPQPGTVLDRSDFVYLYGIFQFTALMFHHSAFDGFSALIKTVTQLLLSPGENR